MLFSTDFARRILVLLFGSSLVVQLIVASLCLFQGGIYGDELKDIFIKLLSIYSIPLGVIVAGMFSQIKSNERNVSKTAFWLAIMLGGLWNLLLLSRTLIFTFSAQDSIANLFTYYDQITSAATFLTAGSLTYFFAAKNTVG